MIIPPLGTVLHYSQGILIIFSKQVNSFSMILHMDTYFPAPVIAVRAVMWLSLVTLVSPVCTPPVNGQVFQCLCCLLVPAFISLDTAS